MADMDIDSFYAIGKKECGEFSAYTRSIKCKVFKELQKSKDDQELVTLIKKYPGDKLLELEKEQCTGDNRRNSMEYPCTLYRQAIKKQKKDTVEYYLENRTALITTFNECQKKHAQIVKSNKGSSEARKYAKTFKCGTVASAAQKLGVYGFRKPIKE